MRAVGRIVRLAEQPVLRVWLRRQRVAVRLQPLPAALATHAADRAHSTTQWNALPDPAAVQAPAAQPAQLAHLAPAGHCASLVHQQGTSAAWHVPVGEVTVLQLPTGHDQLAAVEVAVRQSSLSAGSAPEHDPEHWLSELTHLPLEQFESATQRHAVWPEFRMGAGVSVVVHEVPPVPAHATELGAFSQPWPSSPFADLPVQLEPLQMQWPLAQATSVVHLQVG
jgi:hypothetical protein